MSLCKLGKESTTTQSSPIPLYHLNMTKTSHLLFSFLVHCHCTYIFTQHGNSSAFKAIWDLPNLSLNSIFRLNLHPSQIQCFDLHEIFSSVCYSKSKKVSAGWGRLLVLEVFNYAAGEIKWLSSIRQAAWKERKIIWEGKGQSSISRVFNRNAKHTEVQTMASRRGQIRVKWGNVMIIPLFHF